MASGAIAEVRLVDVTHSIEPGDVLAYRCEECGARFDVAMGEAEGPDTTGGRYGV